MNRTTRQASQQIISRITDWVKTQAEASEQLSTAADAAAFEQRLRTEGLGMLRSTFEILMQSALDNQREDRQCPQCGRRRRHKGQRQRGCLSSIGAIGVNGVYWYCPDCGGQHAADALMPESISKPMQQLLCLLGVSLASFAKASKASEELLGVRVSDNTIRRLCYKYGDKVAVSPVPIEPKTDITGSCDGTMIHTRQDGWRELKAYQYCYGDHRHGRAYLEPADQFVRRLRTAAVALRAGRARQFTWVSDAAEWIDAGVAKQLPMAVRIIDIWHAWQHVHEASRTIYPDDEDKALRWARRYCGILHELGGRILCDRLRHCRYAEPERRQAVEKLRKYLRKNGSRLDYPHFRSLDYPISSGPMESFCKQLGRRLKGPGMRWNKAHVTPMAQLVSLWVNEEWDRHWKKTA
jgi:hypothetical protein